MLSFLSYINYYQKYISTSQTNWFILEKVTQLNDQTLFALHNLFGSDLESALHLLDTKQIVKYELKQAPPFYVSGQFKHHITDQSCTCSSYQNRLKRQDRGMCKHLLAVKLVIQCGLECRTINNRVEYEAALGVFMDRLVSNREVVEIEFE